MTREDADLVTCVLAITCQALRQSGEECAAGLALLSMVLCTAAADQVAPMLVVMTAEMTRSVGSTSSCHLDTILRPMRQRSHPQQPMFLVRTPDGTHKVGDQGVT